MQLNNIKFAYNESSLILKGINCEFETGKITSIIGPNGCGKSTLLGVCNRLNKPYIGSVLLDNRSIYDYSNKEFARIAASVHQQNETKSEITVRELVAFGRTPHKRPFSFLSDSDESIIDEAISLTGLKSFENRITSTLSGGERQRVYLALALAQQPQILFLDEPTTFLDIRYQLEIMEIIKKINSEKGITIVMVLHDINQAIEYSDNIIVMKGGKICAYGEPHTVITRELILDVFEVESTILKKHDGQLYFAATAVMNKKTQEENCMPKDKQIKPTKVITPKRRFINLMLIAAGCLSLAVGIIGIILPILPTFPFLMLTLICFTSGSERFANWFRSSKIYKKYLESYVLTRSMTVAGKIKALIAITLLISIPIILVDVLPMRIVLVTVILLHYFIFIFRIKTIARAELSERVREAREKALAKNDESYQGTE